MSQQKGAEQDLGSAMAAPGADAPARATLAMKPQVQDHIGRQLRAVYDDILKQPLPDRFRELMDKLDQKAGEGQ